MDIGPACKSPYKSSASKFCSNCGTARPIPQPNHCSNPECPKSQIDLGEYDRYCDLCGAPTLYGKEIAKALGQ